MNPSLSELQALIAHYYPGKMLAPDGGLQQYSSNAVDYWVKPREEEGDCGVDYVSWKRAVE